MGQGGQFMIQISHKAKATLEIEGRRQLDFYALSAVVARFLDQAGAKITALDLGLAGESIAYRTDLGDVSLLRCESGSLVLTCDTLRRGDRETGRQICFQLTRRLLTRCPVRAVNWHATQQRLEPQRFSWGRLQDLPQRFASPEMRVVFPAHAGPAA